MYNGYEKKLTKKTLDFKSLLDQRIIFIIQFVFIFIIVKKKTAECFKSRLKLTSGWESVYILSSLNLTVRACRKCR